MKPVFQDKFYDPDQPPNMQRGNCWTAAIASLLELDLHDVPNFVQIDVDGGKDWYVHTIEFLAGHGYMIAQTYDWDAQYKPQPDEYYLVCGKSPRGAGTIRHVVVFQNGEMVHDPHPAQAGLLDNDATYVVRQL